jgi:hypothetical protein
MTQNYPISYPPPFCTHQHYVIRLMFDGALVAEPSRFTTRGKVPTSPPLHSLPSRFTADKPSSADTKQHQSIECYCESQLGWTRCSALLRRSISVLFRGRPRFLNRPIPRQARLNKLTKPAADQRMAVTQRLRYGDHQIESMERFSLITETYRGSAQHQTIY